MIEPHAGSETASEVTASLGVAIDDALDEVRVPAFILGRNGVIRWQNARARELVGEARGRHFSSVVAPEAVHEARNAFARQVMGTARTTSSSIVMRSVDGARLAVDVHAVALDDGRRVEGVFGIMEAAVELESPAPLRKPLTPRQHQVLVELAGGASTEQIAASLGIARDTVRNYVRGILRALGVHSRLAAVVEARRRGLLRA